MEGKPYEGCPQILVDQPDQWQLLAVEQRDQDVDAGLADLREPSNEELIAERPGDHADRAPGYGPSIAFAEASERGHNRTTYAIMVRCASADREPACEPAVTAIGPAHRRRCRNPLAVQHPTRNT